MRPRHYQLHESHMNRILANPLHTTVRLLTMSSVMSGAVLHGAVISSTEYQLTALSGTFSYGRTNWNAYGEFGGNGNIDNVADKSAVEALLSDGYTPLSSGQTGMKNGIYSGYPSTGLHTIEFDFGGGSSNYILNSLTFLSSRSYSSDTSITLEYALANSGWLVAASTTSGALGITNGTANNYTLNFGGVTADSFRITLNGGDQVSIHEISVDGSMVAVAPEPSAAMLGLIGIPFLWRRRRA